MQRQPSFGTGSGASTPTRGGPQALNSPHLRSLAAAVPMTPRFRFGVDVTAHPPQALISPSQVPNPPMSRLSSPPTNNNTAADAGLYGAAAGTSTSASQQPSFPPFNPPTSGGGQEDLLEISAGSAIGAAIPALAAQCLAMSPPRGPSGSGNAVELAPPGTMRGPSATDLPIVPLAAHSHASPNPAVTAIVTVGGGESGDIAPPLMRDSSPVHSPEGSPRPAGTPKKKKSSAGGGPEGLAMPTVASSHQIPLQKIAEGAGFPGPPGPDAHAAVQRRHTDSPGKVDPDGANPLASAHGEPRVLDPQRISQVCVCVTVCVCVCWEGGALDVPHFAAFSPPPQPWHCALGAWAAAGGCLGSYAAGWLYRNQNRRLQLALCPSLITPQLCRFLLSQAVLALAARTGRSGAAGSQEALQLRAIAMFTRRWVGLCVGKARWVLWVCESRPLLCPF